MPGLYIGGMPGVRSAITASHRLVFRSGTLRADLSGGKTISGNCSRDSGNTGNLDVLRAGLLMGKITSSGAFGNFTQIAGQYAPSVLGVTTGAYTSGGTELTVSAAQAVEIVRRVGSSGTGTLYAIGPPSAAGTVALTAVTYSAINTTTGVITVTSLGVNKIAGTWICAADGTHLPRTMIPDGYGCKVTDPDGTSRDQPFGADGGACFPTAGEIRTAQLIPTYPTDTSMIAWLRSQLTSSPGSGQFTFDSDY